MANGSLDAYDALLLSRVGDTEPGVLMTDKNVTGNGT
jgi:hypothetical protein